MKFEKRIGSNQPLKEWFIPLPVNAVFVDVVQIYDEHRRPSDIEYRQDVIDGFLKVDFMLEDWQGFVEYKYETDPNIDVDLPEWIQDIDHHHHDHSHDDHAHEHEHAGSVTIEGGNIVIRIDRSKI